MTDLEDRVRRSLRELVGAYEPGRAAVAQPSAPATHRPSPRTVAIAAALVGAAVAAAIVVRFVGSDPAARLETNREPATIASISSPESNVTVVPSATPTASSPPEPTGSPESPPLSPSQPLVGSAAASCVVAYSDASLGQRGFAFDGTVLSVGEPRSGSGPSEGSVPVRFVVNRWFKGDGPSTFTVEMFAPAARTSVDQGELGPQWGVGSRLLVSGESRYGAGVLVDPVAWYCGFSRTYDEATANQWRDEFADSPAADLGTTSAPPEPSAGDGHVSIPLAGGDALDPTALVTIPLGDQPGEIASQTGVFPTPTAVLPDHLVVFDVARRRGLTGRVLIFDRRGQWQRDLTIDGLNGWYVNWLSGSPNGTVFVVLADNLQHARVVAFRLSGDHFVTVSSMDLEYLGDTDFALTPEGVQSGYGLVMPIPTGVTEQPIVQIGANASGGHRVSEYRTVSGVPLVWTFDVDAEASQAASNDVPGFGSFGDGGWYEETVGADESVQPFLALMSPGGQAHPYRLGTWAMAASDETQIIVSRLTADGALQLAAIDAPPSAPVEPDASGATTPAPPCLASQLSVDGGPMGDGAMGNHRVVVSVTNTSDSTCELAGYPTLQRVFDDGELTPIEAPHGTYFGQPPPQTVVDPGGRMEFWIGTHLCDQFTGLPVDGWRTFQLDLPSGTNLRFTNQTDLACGFSLSRFGRAGD